LQLSGGKGSGQAICLKIVATEPRAQRQSNTNVNKLLLGARVGSVASLLSVFRGKAGLGEFAKNKRHRPHKGSLCHEVESRNCGL
jgi:hypothetical protein